MIDHSSSLQKTSRYSNSVDKYHTANTDDSTDYTDATTDDDNPSHTTTPTTTATTTPSGGYMWRFSSGLVTSTAGVLSGAVGLGVGGVKWVAGKGYSAGGMVVDTTKNIVTKVPVPSVSIPGMRRKDKKE